MLGGVTDQDQRAKICVLGFMCEDGWSLSEYLRVISCL